MKNVDPIRTQVYLRRSDCFFSAMLFLADDLEAYDAAVALLAVHGVISLNDAVQVAMTGKRSKYETTRKQSLRWS